MRKMKRLAVVAAAILLVGVGVLSNVGEISKVEAAPKISVKKKTLKQGQSVNLKISGGKGTIKWSVNNDNVKLNKTTGKKVKVTAVKAGKSVVFAKVGKKSYKCTVVVTKTVLTPTPLPTPTPTPDPTPDPNPTPGEGLEDGTDDNDDSYGPPF